jgi:hypothetical protein
MHQNKLEALATEFVQQMMSEGGAGIAQAVAVRYRKPGGGAAAATVTCVLFAESKDALEGIDFVAKNTRLPLSVSDIFPMRLRTRGYRFVDRGGEVIENGKSVHPDGMCVYIKRAHALSFAMNILRQLEHPRPDADPLLGIPLFGQLERVPDDDL